MTLNLWCYICAIYLSNYSTSTCHSALSISKTNLYVLIKMSFSCIANTSKCFRIWTTNRAQFTARKIKLCFIICWNNYFVQTKLPWWVLLVIWYINDPLRISSQYLLLFFFIFCFSNEIKKIKVKFVSIYLFQFHTFKKKVKTKLWYFTSV